VELSSWTRGQGFRNGSPWTGSIPEPGRNQAKDETAPWWGENSTEAYSSGLANLATGPAQLVRVASGHPGRPEAEVSSVQGQAGGVLVPVGHRRPRSGRGSSACAVAADRHRAHARVDVETGPACRARPGTDPFGHASRIGSGVGSASFSVEITRTDLAPARPGSVVGVDLGVTSLEVVSAGEVIENPRHLEIALRELRRLQRRTARRVGPDRRTGQKPSTRWRQTQARIARLHTAVTTARGDGLAKLTTRLARTHGTVVVDDLRRRRHAEKPAPGPPHRRGRQGRIRTGNSKNTWAGGRVVVADRWYPSSKTCSACGAVKTTLRLSERTYHCDQCGLVADSPTGAGQRRRGNTPTQNTLLHVF
jgi:putative transposase